MKKVSNKSKWMIFSSLLLSVLLIATLILYMVSTGAAKTRTNAELWYIIGIMALAAASFVLVLIVRLRKSKYVKYLNESYFAAYEKISDALVTSVLSRMEVKEIKADLLSLLLDAQEKKRDVSEVTGGDIMAFAKRVQNSFGYRNQFLFNACSIVQYGIFLISFIQALVYLKDLGQVPFFKAEIGLSLMVMFIPLIFVIYPIIKSAIRKEKNFLAFGLPLVFGITFVGLMILLDNTAGNVPWVRYFLDTDVRMISSWWLLAIFAGAAAVAQVIKWYLRRQSIANL